MGQDDSSLSNSNMKTVKLFLSDVDGCMTDGGLYYTEDEREVKRFCVYDGMGMVLLRKHGIPCGILTSEETAIVRHRAQKLNLDYLYMGVGRVVDNKSISKLDAAQEICAKLGITLDEVCFVGDDVNDIPLLEKVGTPVCPANAQPAVKSIPGILVLEHRGGEGAIREICDKILSMV